MQTNNRFRASYTVLNKWKNGDWEGAIKTYFKFDQITTREMAEGKDYHAEWEAEIKKTSSLPAIFGAKKLQVPICEGKQVVQLEDWLDLVYIPDCIDVPILYEFKTGKTSSMQYASDWQIAIYAVGATLSGKYIKMAEIYHYDQYTKKVDMSPVWITDKLLNETHERIISLSSEMHSYFVDNRLYERFGHLINNVNRTNEA
ncbi:MAG: hypothetical protein MOGMAGMI_01817 [Candidatus Omnitrophica bacterium]|nr:hypothetical protein [Ignavibacteriaceae bacterium]MCG3176853.1 hypothetical protein [Candidatus Omnitrophota bacterium]